MRMAHKTGLLFRLKISRLGSVKKLSKIIHKYYEMSVDSKINIKVIKNNDVLMNISEPIRLKDNKWSDYIKSLKTVQKSVNTYLTTLVDQEKSSGESMSIEEDCEDSSEDEDNCESSKRKLEVLDNNRKRKKKS